MHAEPRERDHRHEDRQGEELGLGARRVSGDGDAENGDVGGDVSDKQAEQRDQSARLHETGDEGKAGLHRRNVAQRRQFERRHHVLPSVTFGKDPKEAAPSFALRVR